MEDVYYYRPADINVIVLEKDVYLFRSDNIGLRLEGTSTTYLVEKVFPYLDGQHGLEQVAALTQIEKNELASHLEKLLSAGILRKRNFPVVYTVSDNELSHLLNTGEGLGLKLNEVADLVAQSRILVAGLQGTGTLLVTSLLTAGFRQITLVDPFPCVKEDSQFNPFVYALSDEGKTRQEVLKDHLEKKFTATDIRLGPRELTKENLSGLAENIQLLVGCFDNYFIAAHYWLNQISLSNNIPALYAEIKGFSCRVGPLVIPDQTACFMCYRMRSIATENEFAEAMSYEEFLNKKKHPALHQKQFFPSSIHYTQSQLLNEVLKYFLAPALPSLAGRMIELNTLDLKSSTHSILRKHDCPACKKKRLPRIHIDTAAIKDLALPEGDIYQSKNRLISPRTGIIRKFERFEKDISEPPVPYIYRADVSNHLYQDTKESANNICSGKGLTIQQAKISALGEAVERYSSAVYSTDEIHYAEFENLQGNKLHPRHLVLYHPSQYQSGIEFSPYAADTRLGWSEGFSLVSREKIWIPSIAVFMNYSTISNNEYIMQVTSNGLAAGSTLVNAILSAALELIERDAFIVGWHNQLPFTRIDPFTHPDKDLTSYCRQYERRGVHMQLYRLVTDFPCYVMMAIGLQNGTGTDPFLVVGLGSDFNAATAARSALLEVGQVRPALKQRLRAASTQQRREELIRDPGIVMDIDDHDLLYSDKRMEHALGFILNRPIEPFDWEKNYTGKKEQLDNLVLHMAEKKSDFIYYNLTSPDMESMGLYTCRVIIPGIQPIHFGHKNIRKGGSRLFDLPYQLGYSKTVTSFDQLYNYPHPLA